MSETQSVTVTDEFVAGAPNGVVHTVTPEATASAAATFTNGHDGEHLSVGAATASDEASNDNGSGSTGGGAGEPPVRPFTSATLAPVFKSVGLVLDLTAHKVAKSIVALNKAGGEQFTINDLVDAAARKMLCEIAHDASPDKVLIALGALGGPATLDEVAQRIQTAFDVGRAA